MKKLTVKRLKTKEACDDGIAWFNGCVKEKPSDVMDALLAEKKLDWANWLIARLLSRKDSIRYAIFAAEQVIGIFERLYPDDKRPRQAIEAAKAVLKNNNETTRAAAARAARDAARAARDAVWAAVAARVAGAAAEAAAGDAAGDAVWAAWAAGDAAEAAAWAARAAACAARDARAAARASEAAVWAARAAAKKEKIIRYGMGLCFGREA